MPTVPTGFTQSIRALGVTYVSYLMAHGIKPEIMKAYLDSVIASIKAARAAAPNN